MSDLIHFDYQLLGDHSDMLYAAPNRRRGNGAGSSGAFGLGAGGGGGGDDFEDPPDEDTRDIIIHQMERMETVIDRQLRMSDESNARTAAELKALRESQVENSEMIAAALIKAEETRAAARAEEKKQESEDRWRTTKLQGALGFMLILGVLILAGVVQLKGNYAGVDVTAQNGR